MISTHILDTHRGMPASQVHVALEWLVDGQWQLLHRDATNQDGRLAFVVEPKAATYRLVFEIEEYFRRHNQEPFFLVAPVTFRIVDTARKYHIPLLLSNYSYSTYRGS